MTCKDCIYCKVCDLADDSLYTDEEAIKDDCSEFKNKADFVEVCRCKECNKWKRNCGFTDSPNGHCFYHDIDTNGFDFCSYGERKDT